MKLPGFHVNDMSLAYCTFCKAFKARHSSVLCRRIQRAFVPQLHQIEYFFNHSGEECTWLHPASSAIIVPGWIRWVTWLYHCSCSCPGPSWAHQLFPLGPDLLHQGHNCAIVHRKECEGMAINNEAGNPLWGDLFHRKIFSERVMKPCFIWLLIRQLYRRSYVGRDIFPECTFPVFFSFT